MTIFNNDIMTYYDTLCNDILTHLTNKQLYTFNYK